MGGSRKQSTKVLDESTEEQPPGADRLLVRSGRDTGRMPRVLEMQVSNYCWYSRGPDFRVSLMSALDTRTQETPPVKAGLWLRVNPKEGREGRCEDPYLLPFFSDSKEYDPISHWLRVCVCLCVFACTPTLVHKHVSTHAEAPYLTPVDLFSPWICIQTPLPQIPAL